MSVDFGTTYETAKLPESPEYSVLPPGMYVAIIVDSEKKQTKAGDGAYMSLKFQIVDGEHKGRIVFHNMNLWNKSEQATSIAHAELRKLAEAVNVAAFQKSAEFYNKPMAIKLDVDKKDVEKPRNKIVDFKAIGQTTKAAESSAAKKVTAWATNK